MVLVEQMDMGTTHPSHAYGAESYALEVQGGSACIECGCAWERLHAPQGAATISR